jgi:hypothetical protein
MRVARTWQPGDWFAARPAGAMPWGKWALLVRGFRDNL